MQIRRKHPNPAVKVESLSYVVKVPEAQPQNILEEIVWHKEIEVDKLRERLPLLELRKKIANTAPPCDFLAALKQGKTQPALIAEVKKASPSKGVIREDFDPVAIARTYEQGGATCLSVLTDSKFFQGSYENLSLVRQAVSLPLLCKEFILYPYQIYYARSQGADAVLLIAAILSDQDIAYFVKIVKGLGMTALVEVHSLAEFDRVLAIEGIELIGINNRNLETFKVDLDNTRQLLEARGEKVREKGILIVSESGLHTATDVAKVKQAGANAVLIGESLVKLPDPAAGIQKLFENLG
ncbi:Indole-3-glycerol phosphate synthase [Microcystis aeruginosa NIES-2549]|uniref:Indole-3-glycerol phosphate synthase n=1 Tax=Microcystis aeruginosa NIES-2549 TaxID=1641812 RepID=A0A0F6RN35_MICAE|nr:indole-3-glycerol phosphate synthase TrpC [Microcystis aeruginosa]AKE65778.1 Indole-3-glycerol phosphate synthase [Microcystis aeruginosa NIES-2549]AOC54180.1 Indole-3-glycerol phosphate synthase [Microcystis aeruginosa NIES-2481]